MIAAHLSDRTGKRAIFALLGGFCSIIGYGLLLSNGSAGVHYFGCFLVAAGLYVLVGIPLAWLPNNCPRYAKRTTATGMQLTIGNCAGILSSFIYPTHDKPRYVRGHAVTLAMIGFACIVYAMMVSLAQPHDCRHEEKLTRFRSGLCMHERTNDVMLAWRTTRSPGCLMIKLLRWETRAQDIDIRYRDDERHVN